MQLMLPTAKRMATKDDGAIDRAALSDPGLNLRLAARYMKFIRDSLKVPYELVPAAYNAGENALSRWLRDRAGVPLDLFVEAIPFEETRWYTQRVVATWATYRYLYGKPDADPLPYLQQKLP
jgi:soluble lytic murein transglycosylase